MKSPMSYILGDCVQALKCHLPEVNTIRDRFKDN